MKALRRVFAALLVICVVVVRFSPPATAIALEPGLTVTVTQDGLVPADGQPHTLTITVTRGGDAVAGADVNVAEQPSAKTDSAGQYRFTLQGTENTVIPIEVYAPGGEWLRKAAGLLQPGFGLVDIAAVDRTGAPLIGMADVNGGGFYGSTWLYQGRGAVIAPADSSLTAELASEENARAEVYVFASAVVASDQQRTTLRMDGADPDLGRLAVSIPFASALLYLRTDAEEDHLSHSVQLKHTGTVTLHLPPRAWSMVLNSQQPDANYALSEYHHQVTSGSLTVVNFATENLSRIEATVLPGARVPDSMALRVNMGQTNAPVVNLDLSKPAYVTPLTYEYATFYLNEYVGRRSYNYTLELTAFPAQQPATFAAGEVYRFTAGGPVQAELVPDGRAYLGEQVRLRLRFKNEHGVMNLSRPTEATVTDPDGVVTTLRSDWDTLYWTPEKSGMHTITGASPDPGPHATPAQATATLSLNVQNRVFRLDGDFDGRGIGRSYTIPVTLNDRSSDTPVEYAVLGAPWVEVAPRMGRFEITGTLPADLVEGAQVPVRMRLKGDPQSELHFTAILDETAPVLTLTRVQSRVSKMQHSLSGTASDNLGNRDTHLTVEYSQDPDSPDPRWSRAVTMLGARQFSATWLPPVDQPAFRLRAFLEDMAGNRSPVKEYLVAVPTYDVSIQPMNRSLRAGVANVVTVRVLEDGGPAEGVGFGVNWEGHRTGANGVGKASVTPQAGQIIPVTVGGLAPVELYTVPVGRSALEFTAVIDNSPDAGPPAGLNAADIVYETAVAPGVTRFLGVFRTDRELPKIGPVRSARDSLVRLAEGHGGAYAHAGGSYSALDLLRRSTGVVNVDEIYGSGAYFYRTDDRPAPHNLYTGSDLVRQAVANRGIQPIPAPAGLPVGVMAGGVPAAEAAVRFPGQTDDVAFQWDSGVGNYLRIAGGQPALLEDGSPVSARNVVVLHAPHRSFYRADVKEWEVQAELLGTGSATFYRDGKAWQGTWSKPVHGSPITYAVGGAEMQFAEGTTWVLIVEPTTLPPDGASPVIQEATVDGTQLVLMYDRELNPATVPAGRDFTVLVNQRAQSTPVKVTIDWQKVTLTLATAVQPGASVSLKYKPGSMPIQDKAGHKASGFTSQAVTNNSVPPALSTATIDGDTLTLTYSEELDSSAVPARTDYTVKVNGTTAAVQGVLVSGARVSIRLTNAARAGQLVSLAYTAKTVLLRDLAGNRAAALPSQSVTNVTVPSPLQPVAAVADGVTLSVGYTASLDPTSVPAAADFTVKENGKKLVVKAVSIVNDQVNLTFDVSFRQSTAITVSYARGSKPLRDTGGNRADDLAERAVVNSSMAPSLTAAKLDGSTLTLSFSEPLSSTIVPPVTSFAVKVNGVTAPLKSAEVSGDKVSITLPTAVRAGKIVTVGYTPGTRPLQDPAGNKAVGFAGVAVQNLTQPSPLQVTGATVDGTLVALEYSAPLDERSVPAAADFTLKVAGVKTRVSSVAVTGSQMVLSLSAPVRQAVPVTVSYVVGTKPVRSLEGGHAADDLADRAVVNESAAPKLSSAAVDGAVLTLTFDEALSETSVPANSAFQVKVNGATATVRTVAISRQTLTLTLTAPVKPGKKAVVSYMPGSKPLKDAAGNAVAALASRDVQNVTAPSPLQLSDATIDGVMLRLTYDHDLEPASVPAVSDFTVKVNGSKIAASAVKLSDRTLVLTLASAAKPGSTVLVSYVIGKKPLKDNAGHMGDDFSDRPVENLSAAPNLEDATVTGNLLVLTYDEDLDAGKIPANAAFTVKVNGVAVSASRVTVSGRTVTIRLSTSVGAGKVVTVSYQVVGKALQDAAGNAAEPFTNQSVVNLAP